MNMSEILNIVAMQGFAGISLFSVLLLMGLGLAIIFGQMGVINMAHGEFMAIGAYTVFMSSTLTEKFAPQFMQAYFLFAIVLAFVLAFAAGWLAEWALIRHLYKRPLDTLLATWGLSLAMQQAFRTGISPKEVSPTLPDWLMGSWAPKEGLDIPINGLFVLALTALVTGGVMLALYRSRWGLRVRATVANRAMANATGINTRRRPTGSPSPSAAALRASPVPRSPPSAPPGPPAGSSTSWTPSWSSPSAARPACWARWRRPSASRRRSRSASSS